MTQYGKMPKLMFFLENKPVPNFSKEDLAKVLFRSRHTYINIPSVASSPIFVGYETVEEVDAQYTHLMYRYGRNSSGCRIRIGNQVLIPLPPKSLSYESTTPRSSVSSGSRTSTRSTTPTDYDPSAEGGSTRDMASASQYKNLQQTKRTTLMFFMANKSVPRFSTADMESILVGSDHIFIKIPRCASKPIFVGYETAEEAEAQYRDLQWMYGRGMDECRIRVGYQSLILQPRQVQPTIKKVTSSLTSTGSNTPTEAVTPPRQKTSPEKQYTQGTENNSTNHSEAPEAARHDKPGCSFDPPKSQSIEKVVIIPTDFSGTWDECVFDINDYLTQNYAGAEIISENGTGRVILLTFPNTNSKKETRKFIHVDRPTGEVLRFTMVDNDDGIDEVPIARFGYLPGESERFRIEKEKKVALMESCYEVTLVVDSGKVLVRGKRFNRVCALSSSEFASLKQSDPATKEVA
eukprot:TRINITY_DN9426_c0_g2_i1.p1 TRINITY_DN9426_c0_g2~~TRINITY_DN9426_c0_g2_i1.p1  ORF type:complete len:463 (-),score=77.70 TRINITY_DN9426_c0_g2_i1:115-1503(-)